MNPREISRREFVAWSLSAALLPGVREESRAQSEHGDPRKYGLYWGDLHNHNAVGYAKGSLERSIELAREHLDFFAFTGHASWHDMPKMPGDRHLKWVRGFEVHSKHWPKTRRMIQGAGSKDFVAILRRTRFACNPIRRAKSATGRIRPRPSCAISPPVERAS